MASLREKDVGDRFVRPVVRGSGTGTALRSREQVDSEVKKKIYMYGVISRERLYLSHWSLSTIGSDG